MNLRSEVRGKNWGRRKMRERSRDKTKMESLKRIGTGSEVGDLGVQLLKPKASWCCLHLTCTLWRALLCLVLSVLSHSITKLVWPIFGSSRITPLSAEKIYNPKWILQFSRLLFRQKFWKWTHPSSICLFTIPSVRLSAAVGSCLCKKKKKKK